jgi:anaerobic magnesium-protoporphyrin IX monomethyl ester cyclase
VLILYNPTSTSPGKAPLPLSLMALAAVLEDRFEYKIVDGNLLSAPETDLPDMLLALNATALGMSVMPGPQLNQAVPLAKRIRQMLPELPIIWGGYFATQHTETVLRAGYVDYVVRSQGELTLMELLDALKNGGALSDIAGLSFRSNGEIIHNPPRTLTPLEEFPTVPYHRVDLSHYIHKNYIGSRTIDYNSSFGCPFACNFCAIVSMTNRGWLPEPPTRVADQLKMLRDQYGIDGVLFHDMDFFVSEQRVAEICDRIKDYGLSWWALGRVDELVRYKDSTWQMMRRSGLKMVFCGAETGSDEMLRRMNKGGKASVQLTRDLTVKMKQYGIVPEYSFVLGNPPEPMRDIEITFDFIRNLKELNPAIELILYTYTPVPADAAAGDLYKRAREAGFKFPETLEEWTESPWREFALRRRPNTPWLDHSVHTQVRNFERVINAYYPTVTDLKLTGLRRHLLRLMGGWRYHLKLYDHPLELRLMQRLLAYQRPETTGF